MDFRANGKLMISGEYLVLSGARALAIPVKLGQTLTITESESSQNTINWTTSVKEKEWLRLSFSGAALTPHTPHGLTDFKQRAANFVHNLLLKAKELNPDFLKEEASYSINSEVEFDMSWGLGSSSSLIANVARWAQVDPFRLLFGVSKGSGYDVACALHDSPLLYRFLGQENKPEVELITFNPVFASQLFFVYSGKKQDSAEQIRKFNPAGISKTDIENITQLSEQMAASSNLDTFMQLMQTHEDIIGSHIGMIPVQQRFFSDFPGSIKSLGAWGGDFLMAAAAIAPVDIISYFRKKGHNVIFPFGEMIR